MCASSRVCGCVVSVKLVKPGGGAGREGGEEVAHGEVAQG